MAHASVFKCHSHPFNQDLYLFVCVQKQRKLGRVNIVNGSNVVQFKIKIVRTIHADLSFFANRTVSWR